MNAVHRSPDFDSGSGGCERQADRVRQWLMAARPIVRWGLALTVILALAAASYWGATSLTTFGVRYTLPRSGSSPRTICSRSARYSTSS